MKRDILLSVRTRSLLESAFFYQSSLLSVTPYRHTEMCVVCPHDSAGNMWDMWMYLVKISPFAHDLLAQ